MKRSVAGIIPEDWNAAFIKDVANVVRGGSPRPAGSPLYFDGDYLPWITVSEVTSDEGMYLTETRSRLTRLGSEFTRVVEPGTLLLTNSGATLGVPKITKIRAGANDGIAMLLDLRGVSPGYAYYFLQSKTEYLREVVAPGNGQPNLNTELIGGIPIPLPSMREQERIHAILMAWDDAIDANAKLLANSLKQKQSLMQQLLAGRLRLPGFANSWQQYHLGQLFKERVENDRGDLPLLSITRDEGVIPRGDVGRKDTSNEDKSKYLRICPGDIGYNTMRMWQGVSALSAYEGIVSPAYTVLVPTTLIDARFATYLFKFDPIIHLFYRYSQGLVSDTWNLKYPHFSEIKVSIPDRQQQEAIADVLIAADEQVALLEGKLKLLRAEKCALMADILTGKRRVRVPADEAEAIVP